MKADVERTAEAADSWAGAFLAAVDRAVPLPSLDEWRGLIEGGGSKDYQLPQRLRLHDELKTALASLNRRVAEAQILRVSYQGPSHSLQHHAVSAQFQVIRAEVGQVRQEVERLLAISGRQIKYAEERARKAARRRVERSPVTVLRQIAAGDCACGCVELAKRWLGELDG